MWPRRYCGRTSPKCALGILAVCLLVSLVLSLIVHSRQGHGNTGQPISAEVANDYLPVYKKSRGYVEENTNPAHDEDSAEGEDDGVAYHANDEAYEMAGDALGDKKQQAQEVIRMLNRVQLVRQKQTISMKDVKSDVDFLRQAILEDFRQDLTGSSSRPSCKGDLQQGEVEDLFCIPRPRFLENVKSPCWYEKETEASRRLRCLPYFHILGCAKSGTTDLWDRLLGHPHLLSNDGLLHKEALWWSWRRFGIYGYKKGVPMTFNEYVDKFQDTADLIATSLEKNNHLHSKLITGDASPPDFWDFRGWKNISQNRGLESPGVLIPDLMKHFYPQPRFILLFRDPVYRSYSDYFFTGGGLTSEDFHRDILTTISLLADCVRKHSIQRCFLDSDLYSSMPVRLPFSCYSVFMRHWLRVFPLDSFLTIRTEDYADNTEETLKKVLDFLSLRPLKEGKLKKMAMTEKSRVTLQRQAAGPMRNDTKALLTRLLTPCSRHLAEMLGRPDMAWND